MAVTAAGIVSSAHAAMTMPNEGTENYVWTWDGSTWTRDSGEVGNGPSRSNNIGAFGIFTGDKNSHEFGNSSDGGGILVKENVTVTDIGLGAYGGTIQVNKGGYLNAWSANLKNDSTDSNQANVWVDGILNLRGFNAFDNGTTAKDHNWHIGNNGLIILENTSSLNKNGKKWNIELVIGDEDEISGLTNRTRETLHQERTVIQATGNIYSQIDKLTVLNTSGTVLTEDQAYTIDKTGNALIISFDNYLAYKHISLTWDDSSNETWKHTGDAWKNDAGETTSFINGDTVTFNTTSSVTVDGGVEVDGMTVSGDTVKLTLDRINNGYVEGNVEITDGATLIINSQTDAVGFVRGEINVVQGTLQFDQKDVTGYNGGEKSTRKITIASGSTLVLNHNANETFAGTLILNGTLKGGDKAGADTRWDLFGGSATIKVQDGNQAKLENVGLQLRQNGTNITIGTGASLSVGKISKDEGNGVLNVKGSGELIVTGATSINAVNIINNGKTTFQGSTNLTTFEIKNGGTASFLGNTIIETETRVLTGEISVGSADSHVLFSTSRLEMGDAQSQNGSTLNIASGSTIKITGDKNGTAYGDVSMLLGEWDVSSTLNIHGALLAQSAKALVGDASTNITINQGGTLAVAGIGIASIKGDKTQGVNLTLENGAQMILGEHGIAENLKNYSITLKDGKLGMYTDTVTLGANMTLSGTSGTSFNTEMYSFAADGNSIAQNKDATGGTMTVSGVLSGSGKLIKDGKGALVLSATNTYTGGTLVNAGKVEASNGAALGTGAVTVTHGASVEITEAGGTITVEAFKDNTNAVIEKNGVYVLEKKDNQDSIKFHNAKVSFNYDNDVTANNIFGHGKNNGNGGKESSVALVNNGTGTVTLTNGWNNLEEIHLIKGDVNLQWVMYQGVVAKILMEDGRTLGAHTTADDISSIQNEATLKVSEAVTVGTNTTVNANLHILNGATLTMDGAIAMGSTLTLESGLTLLGNLKDELDNLTLGNPLTLFTGVDTLVLNGTSYNIGTTLTEADGFDMNIIFGNVVEDKYFIAYDENGTVYAGVVVPEPTTATLSLLALTGLAARRRRK